MMARLLLALFTLLQIEGANREQRDGALKARTNFD